MPSRPTPDFEGLIARIADALRVSRLPFMVIGGQAVLVHGEPRLTRDIDITLGVGPDRVVEVIETCRALGLDLLPDDPAAFARRTFVLPAMDSATRTRVDFILSTTSYERQAISRAVQVDLAGRPVPFATAEDLLLHKLFAGRPRDLEDVEGVVARKGEEIDWPYVERWAAEFSSVEGRDGLPDQVRHLRRRLAD